MDFSGPELIIVAMISAEKEYVPFTEHIEPLKANGMVEKWLNEVRMRTQSTNRLNLWKLMAWSKNGLMS